MNLKNEQATVIIKAYDRNMDVVDQHQEFGRKEPSVQLIEFMTNTRVLFPNIIRYEMSIQY